MTTATLEANPANAAAEVMTGRDYVSWSQITTYQKCPLRWHFNYVEQLPKERVSSSLAFGGAIHSAIEHHFCQLLAGEPMLPVEELLKVYDAAWTAESDVPVHFTKGESAKSLLALAGRLLAAFLESALSWPEDEIVGVEETLRAPLIDGVPDMLGRVDLIVRADDALVVRDYKTARTRWSADKLSEQAAQLLLYSEMSSPLAEAYGDLAIQPEFVVLTKAKSPRIDVHPVEFDLAQLDRTKQVISRVWDAMQAGHIYPNPSPMNCSTCPFADACRAWEG